jgi:hypothetical protein
MGEAVEKLTGLLHSGLAYDISYAEVRETQIAAMNERLQEQPGKIKLLKLRAEEAGISEIRSLEDAVPLLLPHTAYKSYPESFLSEQKWDRLTRWLGTVSANPTDNTELDGIADIDEWVSRLGAAGHYVSCSSGTSGKPSMLVATKADMERATEDSVVAFSWGSGVAQKQDHRMFGLAPIAAVPRNEAIGMGLYHAFADPAFPRFAYPVPPITVGSITKMVTLRKAIADGSAQPSEIADFDATSAMRQKAMDDATGICADALIAARGERLYISGMWASLYKIAEEVSKRGYSSKDFTGDNTMYVGGGLKGATVPDNYREVIYETFNLKPERNFMMYGMQEIGSAMPRCQQAGRGRRPRRLLRPVDGRPLGRSDLRRQDRGRLQPLCLRRADAVDPR